MRDPRHIDAYRELINEKDVFFYYYEPLKKEKTRLDICLVGDKEYQKKTFIIKRYGKDAMKLTLYYMTGRVLTNTSKRAK